MTDRSAEENPTEYDFSGLPIVSREAETRQISGAVRLAATVGTFAGGLLTMAAGAALAAGGAQDVARASGSLPGPGDVPFSAQDPAFADLLIERIGEGLVILGSTVSALVVGVTLLTLVRTRVTTPG